MTLQLTHIKPLSNTIVQYGYVTTKGKIAKTIIRVPRQVKATLYFKNNTLNAYLNHQP